jgi:hypothetical protein
VKPAGKLRRGLGYVGLLLDILYPITFFREEPWGVPLNIIERHRAKFQAWIDR